LLAFRDERDPLSFAAWLTTVSPVGSPNNIGVYHFLLENRKSIIQNILFAGVTFPLDHLAKVSWDRVILQEGSRVITVMYSDARLNAIPMVSNLMILEGVTLSLFKTRYAVSRIYQFHISAPPILKPS
jgi:hypothetical protein